MELNYLSRLVIDAADVNGCEVSDLRKINGDAYIYRLREKGRISPHYEIAFTGLEMAHIKSEAAFVHRVEAACKAVLHAEEPA